MDTVTSSSPWRPLTVTSESWSFPTLPENRQGVSSPGMLLVAARMITSVVFSSSWISMERSLSQTSCTSDVSLSTSGGDGTFIQLSECCLVSFCSSVHERPSSKLHSFFVQLLPDVVHMQLLQSSSQLSPSSLLVPSLSKHPETSSALVLDDRNGTEKLQSLLVQLFPDLVHMQLLQSSVQLSPSSLVAPPMSTHCTTEEANIAPVCSSSSVRAWQLTSPLLQEQSLISPWTSMLEESSPSPPSSPQASSHSSHFSRC